MTASECALAIEWQDNLYLGERTKSPLGLGDALGEGTRPACEDSPRGVNTDQEVSLVSVREIPTEAAVAINGSPNVIFVAPGYFPQIVGTPLHDALYGTQPNVPDERDEACTNASTVEVDAKVISANFGFLHVELIGNSGLPQDTWIFPDAQTRITDAKNNTPHVRVGDSIHAAALACKGAGEARFLKLVATRITIT